MLKTNDGITDVAGTTEELRFDLYMIVKELLNRGTYESAEEMSLDIGRAAGILNLPAEAQIAMLFKYDVKAVLDSKQTKESTLMHEIGGVNHVETN